MRLPAEQHWSGRELWGDDFGAEEIADWFADEASAYFELYAADDAYHYEYDELNRRLGYDLLPPGKLFGTALGLGSAFGQELHPLVGRIDQAIIVESAPEYSIRGDHPFDIEWRMASPDGALPLADSEVGIAVSFGVLHHIPNVSRVVRELGRVVESDGYALVREPIVSMGDWRSQRAGLTPRERGIPRSLLLEFCDDAGFDLVNENLCFFAGTRFVERIVRRNRFADPTLIWFDRRMARLTLRNYQYHATSRWKRIRPTATFLVLRRR